MEYAAALPAMAAAAHRFLERLQQAPNAAPPQDTSDTGLVSACSRPPCWTTGEHCKHWVGGGLQWRLSFDTGALQLCMYLMGVLLRKEGELRGILGFLCHAVGHL